VINLTAGPSPKHLLTDYGNMLGSCMGTETPPRVPQHCGAARGEKSVPVTPHLPECGTYFLFGSDGSIKPVGDLAKQELARETIQNLRLDIPKLKAARRAAIDGAIDGGDDLSAEDWRAMADEYDAPGADGRLMPFCFAVRQVLLNYR
jgi:hypothetical protein